MSVLSEGEYDEVTWTCHRCGTDIDMDHYGDIQAHMWAHYEAEDKVRAPQPLERITRDEMLMEVAHVVAKRGTCSRLQVGAVFAVEGRILVSGYNGAPHGSAHCIHEPDSQEGCTVAEHAERNAIYWAASQGIKLGGSDLFVTHQPCYDCARALVSLNVRRVLFAAPYRKPEGLNLLDQEGIEVVDFSKPRRV